jgi:hypothetical protein
MHLNKLVKIEIENNFLEIFYFLFEFQFIIISYIFLIYIWGMAKKT